MIQPEREIQRYFQAWTTILIERGTARHKTDLQLKKRRGIAL